MHLPKDAGTWALIISILGLLLIFPIGLLVNIATPIVQDWWAARSIHALKIRIEMLTRELSELESTPTFGEFEDQMVTEFVLLKVFLRTLSMGTFYGIATILMFLATPETPSIRPHQLAVKAFDLVSFILFVILVLSGFLVSRPQELDKLYRRRSPAHRRQLRTQIVRLANKLSKYHDARS